MTCVSVSRADKLLNVHHLMTDFARYNTELNLSFEIEYGVCKKMNMPNKEIEVHRCAQTSVAFKILLPSGGIG